MTKETAEILLKVRGKITDDSDLMWTSFVTADELRKEIDGFILRLNRGDTEVFKGYIRSFFAHIDVSRTLNAKWVDGGIHKTGGTIRSNLQETEMTHTRATKGVCI